VEDFRNRARVTYWSRSLTIKGEGASEPRAIEEVGLSSVSSLADAPFLLVARAGEFGGRGFRFTGEGVLGGGCLPKESRDERLRLLGMMGRLVAADLGVEEREWREEFLGGKREGSIILFGGPLNAFDYS
jgi:hypothetical protein